jgi:tetratricopeptide (TPR) repeat protein
MLFMQHYVFAQTDTTKLSYRCIRCMPECNADTLYKKLTDGGYAPKAIASIGQFISYYGQEFAGNALQKMCFPKMDTLTSDDYHEYSVQNTKHGNYAEAFAALETAVAMDAKNIEGYYGWVLLYYYRDYNRALMHLNHYDNLTPGVEAPVGENINFLKALCHYQLHDYKAAVKELLLNETFETERFGKKNCNFYIWFYMARCYEKMNDPEKAIAYYKQAIKQSPYATEACYYLGALYQAQHKQKEATLYLRKAYELIKKGYKQQDIYVELFDEVYLPQIEEALKNQ